LSLRILLVDLWQGPGHALYTSGLANALAARGDLEVALLHNAQQDVSLFAPEVRRVAADAPLGIAGAQLGRVLRQPAEVRRALRQVRALAPHAVHLVFSHPWFTAAAPWLSRRVPLLATLHELVPHAGERTLRSYLGIRAAVRHAAAVFVHGESVAEEARRRYPGQAHRFVPIRHGHFAAANEGWFDAAAPEPATFLVFGRLLAYKGPDVALAAFERVAARHPDARLVLAGSGPLGRHAPAIARLAPRVEVVNRFVAPRELGELMSRALAVLLPYREAAGSGVLVTAYAFGRPVIASRLPGLVDHVVEGGTGLLVEPGDPASLAAAMESALAEPGRLREMGARGRRWAREELDWSRPAAVCAETYLRTHRERS
jgi:starch synthase